MPALLTIGYGNRPLDELTDLLKAHDAEWVVDVRSVPSSRFMSEYNRPALERGLRERGLRYLFMGNELGGRPSRDDAYDEDGRVDYRARREQPDFVEAIGRLVDGAVKGHTLALLCSELRPHECHRAKLIAADLVERGIDVRHIDERGQAVSHEAVLARLGGGQLGLLGDDSDVHRSRRSYRVA